jgi:hypothetical protein
MRASLQLQQLVLGAGVMDEDDDTLTESCCEGAVNFMVIELGGGSWQEASLEYGRRKRRMVVGSEVAGCECGQSRLRSGRRRFFVFLFFKPERQRKTNWSAEKSHCHFHRPFLLLMLRVLPG